MFTKLEYVVELLPLVIKLKLEIIKTEEEEEEDDDDNSLLFLDEKLVCLK